MTALWVPTRRCPFPGCNASHRATTKTKPTTGLAHKKMKRISEEETRIKPQHGSEVTSVKSIQTSGTQERALEDRTQLKHESNGLEAKQSRSLNIVYARTVVAFGALGGWHLLPIPEVFGYISSLDENPDIADYRGYGRLGRSEGPSLTALFLAGKDFDHVSSQFDLTLPVRTRHLNFETYFLLQYFNGYGEGLLAYRIRSETVRAGISLVR